MVLGVILLMQTIITCHHLDTSCTVHGVVGRYIILGYSIAQVHGSLGNLHVTMYSIAQVYGSLYSIKPLDYYVLTNHHIMTNV